MEDTTASLARVDTCCASSWIKQCPPNSTTLHGDWPSSGCSANAKSCRLKVTSARSCCCSRSARPSQTPSPISWTSRRTWRCTPALCESTSRRCCRLWSFSHHSP
ncbi:hypothetical protein H257_05317 [Aphanomyces astaci]|uniref:Uncharacterized protein n=1 Tax=Aphanomyces astaci TaxID=112090 RepID=W4GPU7_APHAT|nr:hypothetical protein H257_05317 [Aphanomyces astaci]ETV81722.1 hypothetical protein H257_05317 [Aphanomyces astaci]|eukprot:XP_009828459.1 hypothetical protein H257_05317 [Aphanomyces astaci]